MRNAGFVADNRCIREKTGDITDTASMIKMNMSEEYKVRIINSQLFQSFYQITRCGSRANIDYEFSKPDIGGTRIMR